MHPKELLRSLGLSNAEAVLYLSMLEHGALLASELVKVTGGKRPTVYYALRQLLDRGLVHVVASRGVKRFQAEPPEKLITLLSLRRDELQTQIDEVQAALPELEKKAAHEGVPAVTYYEGEAAMKQVVMETLYCRSGHIDSIAPKDNFFWQVGQTFSQKYINERVARNITTRNLWEQPLKPDILLKSYKGRAQVRILPKTMHGQFRSTVFLYDDKVMYISSLKSGYILLVQSKEHHELMKAIYEGLWEASKEVKVT
jgi:HTH-type transcriptional regulator, sugar sensing transcriptional regulator